MVSPTRIRPGMGAWSLAVAVPGRRRLLHLHTRRQLLTHRQVPLGLYVFVSWLRGPTRSQQQARRCVSG